MLLDSEEDFFSKPEILRVAWHGFCERHTKYFPWSTWQRFFPFQGRDAGTYHPSCTTCQQYYSYPAPFSYENLTHTTLAFPNYFRDVNNVNNNNPSDHISSTTTTNAAATAANNNNNDSRLISQAHLHDEAAFGRAETCCCCCCVAAATGALVMTSQLEDERARQAADADDDEVVQSGIESGIVRSHCCSAQKLNPIFQPQHQDGGHLANDISFVQKVCDSSSFDFSDVNLLASQPGGQGSVRGRRQRVTARCSQGNCDQVVCVDNNSFLLHHQDGDKCGETDEAMRLVKKCSLDGSCDPERSFQSVSFETAPRWSCGVPGLGASIQQVRIVGNI